MSRPTLHTPPGIQNRVLTPDLVPGLAGWQGRLSGAQASPCWVLKMKATTDNISGSPALLNQHTFTSVILQGGNITYCVAVEAAKLLETHILHLPAPIPPSALRTEENRPGK